MEEAVTSESDDLSVTKVVSYGCLAPVEGAELVQEQMRKAARYYNQLIALERCRRVVFRELRKKYVPDLESFEERVETLAAELEALRDAIKSSRKEARRRTDTSEIDAQAKRVHNELRAARAALKATKEIANGHSELRKAVKELDERAGLWQKALRGTSSPFWGTYLLVEASADQARKATVDPAFRAARGRERVKGPTGEGIPEGRIGVQIQLGMRPERLYSCEDSRLRIEPASEWGPWDPSYDGRQAAYGKLWIRVDSEGKRKQPLWAVFPIKIHQPIPANASIKAATVQLRVVGMREQWSAKITYSYEATPKPQKEGLVSLDLGWRKRPDTSLRVAYWADHTGAHGEVTMPTRILGLLRKSRDLREIQDIRFNRAVRWLMRWLAVKKDVPEFLEQERQYLGQWRSHSRLRKLVIFWRNHRFPRDGVIFGALERWLHRSRHLYQWEVNAMTTALAQRKHFYRKIAKQFAQTYGTVALEKFDLAKIKRRKQPEEGTESHQTARAQLHASAPGEFRQAIKYALTREGGLAVELNAAHTTEHCHECGGSCVWNQMEELHHRCEHCGALWDQDRNAAQNLLKFFREQFGDPKSASIARSPRKRAPRFAKRHIKSRDTPPVAE